MGFDPNKNIGQVLKNHYERILHPFDLFQNKKMKIKTEEDRKPEIKKKIKAEKREFVEVIELSDDEEGDRNNKKLCSEDSKENVKKEIMEMEGNNYTPHGIVSR